MNRVFQFIMLLLMATIFSCSNEDNTNNTSESCDEEIKTIFSDAEKQLRFGVHCVDSASQTEENIAKKNVIPVSLNTDEEAKLVMGPSTEWRSGFFPGSCWIMYEITGDDFWKENASQFTWKIADAATRSQHDLGFMFNCSFGLAYELTRDNAFKEVFLEAAKTLSGRFNETVGCVQSWGATSYWDFPVIIDAMMNMELLFKATEMTGDSTYWKRAVSHADKTMQNHFRTDYSSYHVVSYFKNTGEVQCRQTAQGYSDESFWSRGQSWGLYGFTMCYRYTRDKRYLDHACHIADFLLGLDYGDDYS